jgi:hypothetical protein
MAERMHRLALAMPTYHSVPTQVMGAFLQLDRTGVTVTSTTISAGVYLSAAMRSFRDELLEHGDTFERLLIIEADMILPRDALIRHAAQTEPIVGSMYVMHAPPYMPICTAPAPEHDYHRTFTAEEVKGMVNEPGLYECVNVGFGCTSIRRDVLEDWPKGMPMFANRQGLTSDGEAVELGHDVAFGLEARRYGWKSYVDTRILCGHVSEVQHTVRDFLGQFYTEDHPLGRGTGGQVRNTDLAAVPTGDQLEALAR